MSKTWKLKKSWIPEGEKFALEISLSEKELAEFDMLEEDEGEDLDEDSMSEDEDEGVKDCSQGD